MNQQRFKTRIPGTVIKTKNQKEGFRMWKTNYLTSSMVMALAMAVDMRNMDEHVLAQLQADCPGTGLAQIEADCPGSSLVQTEAKPKGLA